MLLPIQIQKNKKSEGHTNFFSDFRHIPDGLGVRIPGFHPGGPGSIPGLGVVFSQNPLYSSFFAIIVYLSKI